jgi:PIN domain nuclease of toxin-antitoxin system
MNLIVDTHIVLWWFSRTRQLSAAVRSYLKDPQNRVYVSAAVAWELAIKVNLRKLDAQRLVDGFRVLIHEEGFFRLGISTDHALRAGLLPRHHSDPFDRMLIAQAQALNCPIVSADARLDSYGVRRIW